MGIDVLGTGAYSLVMELPEDSEKVVKLTFSPDDGYHAFVEFVQQAEVFLPPDLMRHLPKIYSSHAIGNMRVTVLERLEPYRWRIEEQHSDTYGIVREGVAAAMPDGLVFDLHSHNYMLRDGVCVITDPWSHHGDYDCHDDYVEGTCE